MSCWKPFSSRSLSGPHGSGPHSLREPGRQPDCRLWHVESVDKYLVVLWLALAYLEVRKVKTYAVHNLVDIIRLHRQEHARALLEEACPLVLQTRDLQQVYRRYSLAAA